MRLIAVGRRQPRWVEEGFQEYAGRLRGPVELELVEVPAADRTSAKSQSEVVERAKATEADKIEAQIGRDDWLVALDERGKGLTTLALAQVVQSWLDDTRRPVLLIGGADGLHERLKQRAQQVISLSDLTLPHGLARVMVAEALYRSVSLLQGHPYHRGDGSTRGRA